MADIGEWEPLKVPTDGPKRELKEWEKVIDRSNNHDNRLAALEKKDPNSPTLFWVSRNGVIRSYSINAEQVETVL